MAGRIFTSPSYWIDAFARVFVAEGRLDRLGDRWVIGMGASLQAFEEAARRLGAKEVSAPRVRWASVWTLGDVTLASLVGGHGYIEAVVALAWKRGVRLLLGVGLCGGLARDLDVGDLVVPYAVVREDGLTDHYVEPGYPAAAHPILVARLLEHLGSRGWKPRPVIAVSRSSTFTESREWVERMAGLGVACVDVESSTLYTLSTLTGIPAAAALIVSDSLIKERCELGTGSLHGVQARLILDVVELAAKTGMD